MVIKYNLMETKFTKTKPALSRTIRPKSIKYLRQLFKRSSSTKLKKIWHEYLRYNAKRSLKNICEYNKKTKIITASKGKQPQGNKFFFNLQKHKGLRRLTRKPWFVYQQKLNHARLGKRIRSHLYVNNNTARLLSAKSSVITKTNRYLGRGFNRQVWTFWASSKSHRVRKWRRPKRQFIPRWWRRRQRIHLTYGRSWKWFVHTHKRHFRRRHEFKMYMAAIHRQKIRAKYPLSGNKLYAYEYKRQLVSGYRKFLYNRIRARKGLILTELYKKLGKTHKTQYILERLPYEDLAFLNKEGSQKLIEIFDQMTWDTSVLYGNILYALTRMLMPRSSKLKKREIRPYGYSHRWRLRWWHRIRRKRTLRKFYRRRIFRRVVPTRWKIFHRRIIGQQSRMSARVFGLKMKNRWRKRKRMKIWKRKFKKNYKRLRGILRRQSRRIRRSKKGVLIRRIRQYVRGWGARRKFIPWRILRRYRARFISRAPKIVKQRWRNRLTRFRWFRALQLKTRGWKQFVKRRNSLRRKKRKKIQWVKNNFLHWYQTKLLEKRFKKIYNNKPTIDNRAQLGKIRFRTLFSNVSCSAKASMAKTQIKSLINKKMKQGTKKRLKIKLGKYIKRKTRLLQKLFKHSLQKQRKRKKRIDIFYGKLRQRLKQTLYRFKRQLKNKIYKRKKVKAFLQRKKEQFPQRFGSPLKRKRNLATQPPKVWNANVMPSKFATKTFKKTKEFFLFKQAKALLTLQRADIQKIKPLVLKIKSLGFIHIRKYVFEQLQRRLFKQLGFRLHKKSIRRLSKLLANIQVLWPLIVHNHIEEFRQKPKRLKNIPTVGRNKNILKIRTGHLLEQRFSTIPTQLFKTGFVSNSRLNFSVFTPHKISVKNESAVLSVFQFIRRPLYFKLRKRRLRRWRRRKKKAHTKRKRQQRWAFKTMDWKIPEHRKLVRKRKKSKRKKRRFLLYHIVSKWRPKWRFKWHSVRHVKRWQYLYLLHFQLTYFFKNNGVEIPYIKIIAPMWSAQARRRILQRRRWYKIRRMRRKIKYYDNLLKVIYLTGKFKNPKLVSEYFAREICMHRKHSQTINTLKRFFEILKLYAGKPVSVINVGIYGKINWSDRTRFRIVEFGEFTPTRRNFSASLKYGFAPADARTGSFGVRVSLQSNNYLVRYLKHKVPNENMFSVFPQRRLPTSNETRLFKRKFRGLKAATAIAAHQQIHGRVQNWNSLEKWANDKVYMEKAKFELKRNSHYDVRESPRFRNLLREIYETRFSAWLNVQTKIWQNW